MKIAISSKGKEFEKSEVSEIFGRCPYFVIVEINNKEGDKRIDKIEVIENISKNQMGGAGISAAKSIVEKNVEVLITGNIGPRASSVLKQFNVRVYKGNGLIKDVLQKFMDSKLEKIE